MDITETWTIKHAPKTIDEMVLTDASLEKVKIDSLTTNILLSGSPGIGKSVVAKLLTNKFAPESYLYINGSEETSIDIVRTKIMDFLERSGDSKIVRIEEFSNFSNAAQCALKEVTETNLVDSKFILTANDPHKIISAIKSRCIEINLVPDWTKTKKRICDILSAENIPYDKTTIKDILLFCKKFFPDIRKTINELQAACKSGKFINTTVIQLAFAQEVYKMILEKKDVFAIRQYVLDHSDSFAGDFHSLMRSLFDLYAKDKNSSALRIIPDFMFKANNCLDPEVQFSGLLYNLTQK